MRSKIKIDLRVEAEAEEADAKLVDSKKPLPLKPLGDTTLLHYRNLLSTMPSNTSSTEPCYKDQDPIDPRFDPRSERYDRF